MNKHSELYYFRKDLMSMTKKDILDTLIGENGFLKSSISKFEHKALNSQAQIMHFRRRLRRIREQIDYMLAHPYSTGEKFARRTKNKIKTKVIKHGWN